LTVSDTEQVMSGEAAGPSTDDRTGRDRMAFNVVASWAGHLVFVVAGFVLPRVIDRYVGQETLGVWDFGWSLVGHFGLVSGGVMGSVSRFVARYRAANDTANMNSTVSTGLVIYFITGSIILGLSVLTSVMVPYWFGARLAGHIREAQWLILLLGLSIVTEFVFAVYNGVVTACHRWDVHNAISSGVHAMTAGGMILSVVLGGGLLAMAAITWLGEIVAGTLRLLAAYHYCPGLRVSVRLASRTHAWEMTTFGGKSILGHIAHVILYQTNSLLIVRMIGPSALALYSRPAALIRHASRFMNKFAYVLSPTASALHAGGDPAGLQDLLIKGTRYSLYLSLPMILTLAILGKPILLLWMGSRYDQGLVLTVLALGHLAWFVQQAGYQILMGIGRHGVPAAATLVAAFCSIPLALLGMGPLEWGLVGAGLAVVLPLTVVNGLIVPWYSCRTIGVPLWRYAVESAVGPLLSNVPFCACLFVARYLGSDRPGTSLVVGLCMGGLVLGIIYWHRVLPQGMKDTISRRFGRLTRRNPSEG